MIKRAAATIAALFLLTGMAAAQFATNVGSQPGAPPCSQVLAPAPSPAIGVGQIGVPTYVVPPAAPTTGGIINVGQIFGTVIAPYINELANDLVYAGMAYIFWLLKNKLNINIDAEHRATYTQAAQRQASSLIAAGAVDVQGKTITVDSQALAQAVNELAAAAPDALAHDDGQYAADPAMHAWINSLRGGNGIPCCDVADGQRLDDVDWGTHAGHFWVIIEGGRYRVPDEAVITAPNKAGFAIVWPFKAMDDTTGNGTLTTAQVGLFTATSGGGTAVITSGTAVTVSTAADGTNNNTQNIGANNTASQAYTLAGFPALYFRVTGAEGSAQTANIALLVIPLP